MYAAEERAKCILFIRAGVVLIRGSLAQRREEVGEILLVRKIVALQDDTIVIGDRRKMRYVIFRPG